MEFTSKNVPIILPVFKRPEFLIRNLDHLRQCDGIENFTLHFSFDTKSKIFEEGRQILKICNAWSFCEKHIHENTTVGQQGSLNSTGAPGFVFSKIGEHPAFIYIEEDVIVCKKYLQMSLECLQKYYENPWVSCISGHYFRKHQENEGSEASLDLAIPNAMICGGIASWWNRWKWIHERLKNYCQTPTSLANLTKEKMKIPRSHSSIAGEFQTSKNPFTPRNVHGAGLLFLYNIIHGRYTLYPNLPLGTHIGWYGWHINKRANPKGPPKYAQAECPWFQPDITYGPFPEVNKEFVMRSLGISSEELKDPDPL